MSFETIKNLLDELTARGYIVKGEPEDPIDIKEYRRKSTQAKCDITNMQKGELDKTDGYDCPKCLNRGYWFMSRPNGEYYDEVMVECKCIAIRKSLKRLVNSGLKDVVHRYRFEKYEAVDEWQKHLLDKATQYADKNDGKWLFIGGQSGCGKTHLCTAVSIDLLKKGKDVKYMLWQDEASRLKRLMNSLPFSDELEAYKDVDVLYIDDLFKTGRDENDAQKPTIADIKLAFDILNTRMSRGRITIISSECTLPDLIEIDEAIAGRIKQMCGEYCISIGKDRNKNYRLR